MKEVIATFSCSGSFLSKISHKRFTSVVRIRVNRTGIGRAIVKQISMGTA